MSGLKLVTLLASCLAICVLHVESQPQRLADNRLNFVSLHDLKTPFSWLFSDSRNQDTDDLRLAPKRDTSYSPWTGKKRSESPGIPKPKKYRPWTGKRKRTGLDDEDSLRQLDSSPSMRKWENFHKKAQFHWDRMKKSDYNWDRMKKDNFAWDRFKKEDGDANNLYIWDRLKKDMEIPNESSPHHQKRDDYSDQYQRLY